MPVSSGPAVASVAASASADRPPQLVHSHSMPAIDRAAFAATGGAPPRLSPPSPTVEPLVAAPVAPRPAADAAAKSAQASPIAAPLASPAVPAVPATVSVPPPAVPTPPTQPPAQGAGLPTPPTQPPPPQTATSLALERTLSLSALSLSSASQLLSNTKSLVAPLDQLLNAVDRIVPLPPVAAAKSVPPTPTPTPATLTAATTATPAATPTPTSTPPVLTSSGGASAPSQPAAVSAPPAAAAADSRPHLLTQTVHEAVQLWRTTMRVGQLPALLSHWLASYDPAAPPPRVPGAWLTEILTANFEINSVRRPLDLTRNSISFRDS